MKNVFRSVSIAAFAFIAAFVITTAMPSITIAGSCDYCDSLFVVKGPAYDACVAEHCSGATAKKHGDGGGGAKTPKEIWCPSADNGNGAMIPADKPCLGCDTLGLILSEDGRSCVDACAPVAPLLSCLSWCPSKNDGTGGFAGIGEKCADCKFGNNGVACLKEAPVSIANQLKPLTAKLTAIQDSLDELKATSSKPFWLETWFWILVILGLLNAVLGGLCLKRLRRSNK